MNNIGDHTRVVDPYPENSGVYALALSAHKDFRGDVEVTWWYRDKTSDADKQRMLCSASWLLQGVFRDVRGSQPREDRLADGAPVALFNTRVVALFVHAFYQQRIEAAAMSLTMAQQWHSCLPGE